MREWEVRALDLVAQPAFVERGRIDAIPAPDLYLGDAPHTVQAREEFRRMAGLAQGRPFGELWLDDVVVVGPSGLILDPAEGVLWCGEPLGWSLRETRRGVRALGGKMPHAHLARLGVSPTATIESASLLALPGFDIFGHWLIDVVPRLLWAEGQSDGRPIAGPVGPWADELGAAVGGAWSQRLTLAPDEAVRVGRLGLLTLPKFVRILDRDSARTAWARLGAGLAARGGTSTDKVYVSRSRWERRERLHNDPEIEDLMTRRGFMVIHPQELTHAEQHRVFSRARTVVGVDGSGLHGIVHAPPGVHLTVIDLDRINLFHGSVANAAGHHVSHLAADQTPDGWRLDPRILAAHLDGLSAEG